MINPYATLAYLRDEVDTPVSDPLAGFTIVRAGAPGGLPTRMLLDGTYAIVMMVPTGDAYLWQQAAAQALITDAAFDRAAVEARPDMHDAPASASTPRRRDGNARLLVLRRGTLIGSLPLRAGLRVRLPAVGPAEVEIEPVDFSLDAAAMRGAPASATRLSVAWRPLAGAAPHYDPPAIAQAVKQLAEAQQRSHTRAVFLRRARRRKERFDA